MAKKNKQLVKLESTAGTGYFYLTQRDPRIQPEKLEKKKYDPRAINEKTGNRGAHVLFKEGKNKFK